VCEVALKERVPLILLVREMPYSRIHLENMLKVTEAGAVVVPASPGFYHNPRTLEDMIDFVVGKVLDLLGVPHALFRRWRE
jgi:4-hydroxy-3-polyprenylbenzoate decarboxylase